MKANWVRYTLAVIAFVLLCLGTSAFELTNFLTTQYALLDLLGNFESFGVRWGNILAIAFVLADISGLGLLHNPENRREKQLFFYLGVLWFLAGGFDLFLSIYTFATVIFRSNSIGIQVFGENTAWIFAYGLALFELGIRIGLMGVFVKIKGFPYPKPMPVPTQNSPLRHEPHFLNTNPEGGGPTPLGG